MENELSYCLEGKLENGNLICTKCVNNSYLINNICSCNHDSFSKDSKWCYKCNDPKHGNPGCEESEGCEYILDNDQLNCNKCKDGYFSYTEGQCFLCSSIIPNCNKCHYDVTNEKLICDSCISDIYILNTEENICQLNDCEEYPEISPGCIICKDKLNEYKENKKCQRCKYGYFKTKDEKCVYCRSEQFGGPGCDECGYEKNENGIETDNIICKECYPFYPYLKLNSGYSYIYNDKYYDYYSFSFRHYYYGYINQNISYNSKFLSPKGKCYDCKILFSDACDQCNFVKNSEGIENLKCTACSIGYYLTPEGNCVNITSIIKKIPHCAQHLFSIGEIKFYMYISDYSNNFVIYIYNEFNLSNYNNQISKIISSGLNEISSNCSYCNNGYFTNDNKICEQLNYDKCSFNSILENYNKYDSCYDYCYNQVLIKMKANGKLKNETVECSYSNLYTYHYNYTRFITFFGENNNIKSCLNNSGDGGDYSPDNLKYCRQAYYYLDNNTYMCINCINNYILDNATNFCIKNISNNKIEDKYIIPESIYNNCKNKLEDCTLVIMKKKKKNM